MDRMKRLVDTMRNLMEGQFSGSIKINFSQGSLGRVEKTEEIDEAGITFFTENSGARPREEKNYHHESV